MSKLKASLHPLSAAVGAAQVVSGHLAVLTHHGDSAARATPTVTKAHKCEQARTAYYQLYANPACRTLKCSRFY
jgi:hypothetical protein